MNLYQITTNDNVTWTVTAIDIAMALLVWRASFPRDIDDVVKAELVK